MKRQPMNWKNTFANDVTDKLLTSKVDKQLTRLKRQNKTNKKTTQTKKSVIWALDSVETILWQ